MTMELILITPFSYPEVTFDYFLKLHGLILFLKNYFFYYAWFSFLAYENLPTFVCSAIHLKGFLLYYIQNL